MTIWDSRDLPGDESRFLVELIKTWKPATTLEVGCNTGRELKLLTNFTSVYGIDRDEEKIKEARFNILTGHFRVCDAERLPFSDDKFDFVYSCDILSKSPANQAKKIIDEMVRVSRDKILVISYLGTRMSANPDQFMSAKRNTYTHDFELLFFGQKVQILISMKKQAGLDLFQIILVQKVQFKGIEQRVTVLEVEAKLGFFGRWRKRLHL